MENHLQCVEANGRDNSVTLGLKEKVSMGFQQRLKRPLIRR